MRIALLTDGLWPLRVGGMEKHSWYFAKYLAKTGNDVHLFYPVQKVLFENHVPVFKGTHGITEYAIVEPQRGKLPGHYIRESRAVSELIYKKIRPLLSDFDLIYVQGFAGWELLQAKNSGLNCPPIWVNFHGLEMYQRAPGFWPKVVQIFFRPAVNENLKLADAAISLGGELGNILQEVVEKRVPVIEIPIGVEATWVREDEPELKTNRPLRFIFIGRNEKRKGLILLNTVLEKMNNRNDFVFDFIGPVSDSEKIISEKIKYHGLLKDENQIREIIEQRKSL